SMDSHSSFTISTKAFSGPQRADWRFDDTDLDGIRVRRVTLRVAHYQVAWGPPPWARMGPPPKGKGPKGGPPRRREWPRVALTFERRPFLPSIYIQAAYDKSRTDGPLGKKLRDLEQQLARQEEATEETLRVLGRTLLALSLTTFGVGLVGVF